MAALAIEVVLVGLPPSSLQTQALMNGHTYGVDCSDLKITSFATLPHSANLEELPAPAVVLLNAELDSALSDLDSMRQIWHDSFVIVCATQVKMALIHQLLAKGAHDFLELPFEPDNVAQRIYGRIGAYLYRSRESTRQLGRLKLNVMQRTVSNGDQTAFLTPIETRIIATFADSIGGVIERSAMKRLCWGDISITDNALNRKIYEVRRTLRKLSEDINIRTIYGHGFELEVAENAQY